MCWGIRGEEEGGGRSDPPSPALPAVEVGGDPIRSDPITTSSIGIENVLENRSYLHIQGSTSMIGAMRQLSSDLYFVRGWLSLYDSNAGTAVERVRKVLRPSGL